MLTWLAVFGCFAVITAIIFPIAWFLLPTARSRRDASKRRPAEPDTLEADIKIFRWLSFLVMYFFWLMLVIFVSASASNEPFRMESELDLTLQESPKSIAPMPVIGISDEGEVEFLELRLAPEDHQLEALHLRLRGLRPHFDANEPALIRPEPDTTHQRVIEVLSAIQRAGIRESILL